MPETIPADLVTLTDVLRRRGLPDDAVHKPALGRLVAKAWREQTGRDIATPYGSKADGSGGMHTLAAYPESFVPVIQRLLDEALASTRADLERRAPRPKAVEDALAGKPRLRDVTPAIGSRFWWATEDDS